MKQRIKSNKFIILAMCAVLSLFMGFACLISAKFTRADESTADANTFEMLSGAEVRTEDPYGLRFKVRVGSAVKEAIESVKNTETETNKGFLIFPKQYLASVTGENPDYKDKENGGLTDYIDIPIGNGTWYYEVDDNDKQTGYYLYNGAIHTIKETNRSLEYAAIAYYKKSDGSYVYADFDKTFGRSITYVLSKGYLNSATERTTVSTCFDWFGTQNYPVSIESEEDMFAFANAINGGETFESKYFKLNNDLSLDGWTAIRSGFSGTLDCNGKTVTLLSGGDKFVECGTVTKTDGTVVGDKQYAFKATEGSAKNVFDEVSKVKAVFNGVADASSYNGSKSVKLSVLPNNASPVIELNYTKQELEQLKTDGVYNQVILQVKFMGENLSNNNSITTNSGEKIPCILTKAGLSTITVDTWLTYTMGLDDFITTMGITFVNNDKTYTLADNQTLLSKVWAGAGKTFDVYVGDITLINASYNEYGMTMAPEYMGKVTVNDDSKSPNYYIANEDLLIKENYTGNALSMSLAGGSKYYLNMNYSAEEYAEIKETYNMVKFNVYFNVEGSTFTLNDGMKRGANNISALFKNADKKNNQWYTVTVSLSDVITAMDGSSKIYLFTPYIVDTTVTMYLGDVTLDFVEYGMTMSEKYNNVVTSSQTMSQPTFAYIANGFDGFPLGTYTGNAIEIDLVGNVYYFITMNHSAKDYATIKDVYDTVTINVCFSVVADNGGYLTLNSNCTDETTKTTSLMKDTDKVNITKNSWISLEYDIDDFISAMGGTEGTGYKLNLFRTFINNATCKAYIGDIVFSKKVS